MATSIEWTNDTWNPVVGCSPVSEGCRNCYAARIAIPRGHSPNAKMRAAYEGTSEMRGAGKARRAVFTGKVNMLPDRLHQPLHWRKPRRVFVNSMSDLFHEDVPDQFICDVFDIMRQCPQHVFQVLTKRPERMQDFCARLRFDGYGTPGGRVSLADSPDGPGYRLMGGNGCTGMTWVWLGTSVEDQDAAVERIPHLLRTPAAVRFLSCEPLLGPLDLTHLKPPGWTWLNCLNGRQHFGRGVFSDGGQIDWVIVGGESGPGARACDIGWIESIVEQCRDASVPVFVKQLGTRSVGWHVYPATRYLGTDQALKFLDSKGGDWHEWPAELCVREFPTVQVPA